jgi:hypothetical protein
MSPRATPENGANVARAVHFMNGASLLLTHDAAFDEHHDQSALLFAVAQAISSGGRKGLTLIEGLPVSRLHVVHHIAYAPLLLGKSSGADPDGDEDGNN